MRAFVRSSAMLAALGLIAAVGVSAQQQQQPAPPPQAFPGPEVQDLFVQWPLPKGAEVYANIDGHKIHKDVEALAAISARYRDQINKQYWGRIIGTESDQWTAEWLSGRFREIGLTDVKIQPFDLPDQWYPKSFSVVAKSGSETLQLSTAQPFFNTAGTPAAGLNGLEAVYVGLGTEADFMGKDVRGKAVFTYSMLGAPNYGAVRRAGQKGAAVVFDVTMLPGNLRYQAYPSQAPVPTFTVGNEDGDKLRTMIETAAAGAPVRVDVKLEIVKRPNSKTSLVWGTLPGASDETVYVTAHKDGWFYAAGDNGGGVASMLGLAEHYAKIPQAQRPRTMVFVGLDGHHNSGQENGTQVGINWMIQNRATLFNRTALMINAEHPSTVQTMIRPRYTNEGIAWGNTYMPQQWYAGGPTLTAIAMKAFDEFGVTHYIEGQRKNTAPPATDMGSFYRYMPGLVTSEYHHYFHTDLETPEAVPWTGLEASTRAYARIIDEVNKLPLSVMRKDLTPTAGGN